MYGAMILAIAKGVRSLENLTWAAISGQYNFPLKETLEKIAVFEATDEELIEAFNLYKPFLEQVYYGSERKINS